MQLLDVAARSAVVLLRQPEMSVLADSVAAGRDDGKGAR
jgi:hypothetical protein